MQGPEYTKRQRTILINNQNLDTGNQFDYLAKKEKEIKLDSQTDPGFKAKKQQT